MGPWKRLIGNYSYILITVLHYSCLFHKLTNIMILFCFVFRKWFINKLNNTAAENVFVVLDCVLDHRFTELKIRIPVSSSSGLYPSFSKLVSIISCRSPALEQLEIHAFHSETAAPITLTDGDLESCSMLASNATRLTYLKKLCFRNGVLNNRNNWNFHLPCDTLLDASNRSVFSLVGKFFPALIELKVDGFCPKNEDYIGLVLGELADILLPSADKKWIQDLDLENLRVAPDFTSSLCSTLQVLRLESRLFHHAPYCLSMIGEATCVFVLRHLLELILVKFEGYTVDQHECFVFAIKFLRDHRDIVDGNKEQKEFDKVCSEAASRIIRFQKNAVTPHILQFGIGILLFFKYILSVTFLKKKII